MNHLIRLPERIVLPRLSDVINNGVDFLRSRSTDDLVEFIVLDFKGAFKQLKVHASERRYLSGEYSGG